MTATGSVPATPVGRSPRRRLLPVVAAVLVVAGLLAYGGASVIVYDQLSAVTAHCGGADADQSPTSFQVAGIDTRPYLMPAPESVTFPSRNDPDVKISGWWEPSSAGLDVPTIVLVHGHDGCKRNPTNLLAAGMLHRHGMAVLLIDLRNHGDSTVTNGRYAGGTTEYRDVLGAWDWLRTRGVPTGDIGLLGFSLGAATAMIAMGEEPRVAATWEDSGFADIGEAIRDELARNHYPTWLELGGVVAGRILSGDDLEAHSPLETTAVLAGRPIFITHGAADQRLSVRYAFELAAGVWEHGGQVTPWIIPGAGHIQAVTLVPAEYERRLVAFFTAALGGQPRLGPVDGTPTVRVGTGRDDRPGAHTAIPS